MASMPRPACSPPRQRRKPSRGRSWSWAWSPPHTHGLIQLLTVLEQQGVDGASLRGLPLRSLTRMTVTSRYPLDDTPPMDLFETRDSEQAIATATAVPDWIERLDQEDG